MEVLRYEQRTLRRGPVELGAFVAGPAGAPVVVLVNALGVEQRALAPLAARLARRHRVVIGERIGLSASAGAEVPCGPAEHAADLVAILDALGIGAAHALVGWCTGAAIALRFAATCPDRARSLVLLNAAFAFEQDVPATDHQRTLAAILPRVVRTPSLARTFARMLADTAAPPAWAAAPDPTLAEAIAAPVRDADALRRYARQFTAFLAEADDTLFQRVRSPSLVIAGDRDAVAHPAQSEEIARRLPDAELQRVPEGDHYLLWNADPLVEALEDFWHRRLAAPRPRDGRAPT